MSTDVKDESAVKLHKAIFMLCQIYFWEQTLSDLSMALASCEHPKYITFTHL